MRTANPTLNENTFGRAASYSTQSMTINGTVNKTGILLILLVCGAVFTWNQVTHQSANAPAWILGGAIGGLILALVTFFKKEWAPVTAPIYAVLEGLFLGGISAFTEARFPNSNIVFQAVILTFGTLGCLLFAYRTGLIRATQNFKLGVFAATGAIALLYLVGLS